MPASARKVGGRRMSGASRKAAVSRRKDHNGNKTFFLSDDHKIKDVIILNDEPEVAPQALPPKVTHAKMKQTSNKHVKMSMNRSVQKQFRRSGRIGQARREIRSIRKSRM
jgi:hypothetical protein